MGKGGGSQGVALRSYLFRRVTDSARGGLQLPESVTLPEGDKRRARSDGTADAAL